MIEVKGDYPQEESSLVLHAKRELSLLQDPEDDMQDLMNSQILEMVRTFSRHGHSGFSANYAANLINKLLRYEIITPLTGEDHEWNDVSDMGDGRDVYQNNRCSALFKDGEDGKPYYIDAMVKVDPNGNGWHGRAYLSKEDYLKGGDQISGSWYIKGFPFVPKTFRIDCEELEVKPDDWESWIKNKSDLDQMYDHYESPKIYN